MKKLFLLLSLSVLGYTGNAQGGDPDYTFSAGTGADGTVSSIALQPDGKFIVVGSFNNYHGSPASKIARINTDGSIDASFNSGAGTNNAIQACLLQPDGKILVAGLFSSYNGTTRNTIARLNVDGSLDTSFDPGAGASLFVTTMAIQPDNKIIIGGIFATYNGIARNNICRLNADGSLDTAFDPGTGADNYIASVALQTDGKILIGGLFINYNGTSRNHIARLNTDGTLDISFDPGTGTDDEISTLLIQPDNTILIGGNFSTYNGVTKNSLARIEADGSLDITFDPGLGADGYILTFSIQSDSKIIIGGLFTHYNGKVKNHIARINADGSLDANFNNGAGADGSINTSAIQSDGKILIGGNFINYNSTLKNRLTRLYNACGLLFSLKNQTNCAGQNYVYNNHTYTTTGVYEDTLQSALGCDSIVITILTINPYPTVVNASKIICAGSSYTIGNHSYTDAGTYTDTLLAISGCDSIVNTQLTILPTATDNYQTICAGKSYILIDSTYTISGTYMNIIKNVGGLGCDLTVTTYLTVTPAVETNNLQTICRGESYSINGNTYTLPDTYRDTLKTTTGCDSVIVTVLTLNQPDISVTQNGTTLTANAINASYQWIDCTNNNTNITGETNQTFSATISGSYAVVINNNNCTDTSSCYAVVTTNINEPTWQSSISIYPNPAQSELQLVTDPTTTTKSYSVINTTGQEVTNGNTKKIDVSILPAGMYLLVVETEKGIWRKQFIKQ